MYNLALEQNCWGTQPTLGYRHFHSRRSKTLHSLMQLFCTVNAYSEWRKGLFALAYDRYIIIVNLMTQYLGLLMGLCRGMCSLNIITKLAV
jgi:hypothetical protein